MTVNPGTDQSPPVSRAFMSRLREVLTARLPAGPGWVVWVDGVVEELAGCEGVMLSREDALAIATALNGGTWVTDSDAAAARRAAMVDRLRAEARR